MTLTDVKVKIREIIAKRHPTLERDGKHCICYFCRKGRDDIEMVRMIMDVVKEFAREIRK